MQSGESEKNGDTSQKDKIIVNEEEEKHNDSIAFGAYCGFLKGFAVGKELANAQEEQISIEKVNEAYNSENQQSSNEREAKLMKQLLSLLEESSGEINLDEMLKRFIGWC